MPVPAAAGALLLLLLAAAAVALCSPSTTATRQHEPARRRPAVPAVYVFGDSLVDVGNNEFLPPPAPRPLPPDGVDLPRQVARRTGRFTNGYNLADIIAQHVGFEMSPPAYLSLSSAPLSSPGSGDDLLRARVGANYASGGSGILDITGNGTITLREQVQLFAETKDRITRAGLVERDRLGDLLARSLFVICTGGNDFDAFDDGGVPASEVPAFIAGMVATQIERINELYRLGARKLAVLDMLPVGCLPSQRALTADGDCDAVGNAMARLFNAVLRTEMASAAAAAAMPGVTYSIASLYNAYYDMIADPALAGLREVEVACCGGGKFNGEVGCTVAARLCAHRDEYLFWDVVHGTEAAYRGAVHAFFYGTVRHAEPINLAQLVGTPAAATTRAYS